MNMTTVRALWVPSPQVNAPNGSGLTDSGPTYFDRMLDLPDGTVLFTDGSSGLYVYKPDGAPLAADQACHRNSFLRMPMPALTVSGTLFNGITQGAAFGDDAQMDSNYPLVRFTDGNGNVTYGRTYNWSSTGVQTGTNFETTQVSVPADLAPGTYSLQVVANGNPSAPVTFQSPVWVDFNYSKAFPQLGTYANPYSTLGAGASTQCDHRRH